MTLEDFFESSSTLLDVTSTGSSLTILSFGGGQDSTAILLKMLFDVDFRNKYAPDRLLVVMSNTGNEHPETYDHVTKMERLCEDYDIDFILLEPEMGFHYENWKTLTYQFQVNNTIGMKVGKKSCTDKLKIQPIYRFLNNWIHEEYGFVELNKQALTQFAEDYGKINVLIGFGADERQRQSQRPIPYIIKKRTNMKKVEKALKRLQKKKLAFNKENLINAMYLNKTQREYLTIIQISAIFFIFILNLQ